MHYIDYGLTVAHRSVFDDLPGDVTLDLAAIYEELGKAGRLAGLEVFRRFYEIGSFSGIAELEAHLGEGEHA